MSLNVNQHPFYKPLWLRIAIVLVCVSWLVMEIYAGDGLFLVIAGAFLAYSVWAFLINYRHEPKA